MLKVNAGKKKNLRFERDGLSHCNISLNNKNLEAVDEFWYLEENFCRNGNGMADVKSYKGEKLECRESPCEFICRVVKKLACRSTRPNSDALM